jgi:hypothetical protein
MQTELKPGVLEYWSTGELEFEREQELQPNNVNWLEHKLENKDFRKVKLFLN